MRKILDFNQFSLFESELSNTKSNLFDLNNKLVYQTVKDLKTIKVKGKEYLFMCVGSGMQTYAKSVSDKNPKLGEVLSKIASYKDKVLAFCPDGVYIISEAVCNGVISMGSSIFSYVKPGDITVGVSVVYILNKINAYYKKYGDSSLNESIQDPAALFKIIIGDLYGLASTSPKASEAISVLVVGSYKSSTSSFKTIPNFLEDCVYNPAKDLGIRSVNIGRNIEDFYKVAQNTLNNLSIPINKTIEEGVEKLSEIIEGGIKKGEIFSTRLNKECVDSLKTLQSRISPNGKEVIAKSKPIWDSIAGKKRSN